MSKLELVICGSKINIEPMGYCNADKQRDYQKHWQAAQRVMRKDKVLQMMGDKCCRCGFDDQRALQIDHIEPILRKNRGTGERICGSTLIAKIANGTVTILGVQLLCANCHCIKTAEEDRAKFGKSGTPPKFSPSTKSL